MDRASAVSELRTFGVVCIVLAPVGWLMAAISNVKSDTDYWMQLGVMSVASVAALVFGLAAVFRRIWARPGLVALCWFGASMFIGPAVVFAVRALLAQRWEMALFAVAIACTGLPFIGMAMRLRQLQKYLALEA